MDDALSCPVCLVPFDEGAHVPKLLRCGHTFCVTCVDKLRSTAPGPMNCPTCRQPTPPSSNLATNYVVLGLVTQQTQQAQRGAKRPAPLDLCSLCGKVTAEFRCTRCLCLACAPCAEDHVRRSGHAVSRLPSPPEHVCTSQQFCDPCGVSFCASCPVDHLRHTLVKSAASLLERAQEHALRLEPVMTMLDMQAEQVERRAKEVHVELEELERDTTAALTRHFASLHARTDSLTALKLVALAKQRAELTPHLEALRGAELRALLSNDHESVALGAKLAELSTLVKAAEKREENAHDTLLPCADEDVRVLRRGSPLLLTKLFTVGPELHTSHAHSINGNVSRGSAWIACPAGKSCSSPAMCTFLHPHPVSDSAAWDEVAAEAANHPIAALNAAAYARQRTLPNDPLGFESERVAQLAAPAIVTLEGAKAAGPDGVHAAEALGTWYRSVRDATREFKQWEAAADRGSTASQWRCTMRVSERDPASAVRFARPAAMSGHPAAMRHFGVKLLADRGENSNSALAVAWIRRAADRGDADAQKMLGRMYSEGKILTADAAQATLWLRRAAEGGSASAQFLLSQRLREQGDRPAADTWLRRAADAGHADAAEELQRGQRSSAEAPIVID